MDMLIDDLKKLSWRPGTIDRLISLHDDIKTPSVKETVCQDIHKEILLWIPAFELMAAKMKNDPIAAPTKDEKAFYKWALEYRSNKLNKSTQEVSNREPERD